MYNLNTDSVFIIAEAGVNHNGCLQRAFELVDAAKAANADAVKFQIAVPELVAAASAEKAQYQKDTTGETQSQLDMLKNLLLPLEDFYKIKQYAISRDILFFATAFDTPSLDYLNQLKVPLLKIPSGEITNIPLLRKIASFGLPTILSSGMSSLGDIEQALFVLNESGLQSDKIRLMHCTSQYPTPLDEVNLRAIHTLRSAFCLPVGYSDHTNGISVPLAAVALGATLIEKHLTLSCLLPGPDHRASLEPHEFLNMVTGIREVEKSLGSSRKKPSPSELDTMKVARRSLVAKTKIRLGEIFTVDNLTTKRPGTGICASEWDNYIGTKAIKDYQPDDLI